MSIYQEVLRSELGSLRDDIRRLHEAVVTLDPDRSFTVEEAAEFLRVHPQTVRTQTKIGALPSTRIGKRYTYAKIDLINFRERRKKQIDSSPKLRQVK